MKQDLDTTKLIIDSEQAEVFASALSPYEIREFVKKLQNGDKETK